MYTKSKYESENLYLSFCNLCILKQKRDCIYMRLRLANGDTAVDTDFAWKIKKKRGPDGRDGCRFHEIDGRANVLSNKPVVISIDQGQEHDWRSA